MRLGIQLVALKDRKNALKNPYAHLHEHDITFESIEQSMMLWDPIRYAETCPSSDGACALVLATEDALSGPRPPAWSASSTPWPVRRSWRWRGRPTR